jgi:hypothetical protein
VGGRQPAGDPRRPGQDEHGAATAAIVTALYLAWTGPSAIEIGTFLVGVTVVPAPMSTVIGLLGRQTLGPRFW